MVVCAGATAAGKTVLLKKLSGVEQDFDPRSVNTLPTVGINHFKVSISCGRASRGQSSSKFGRKRGNGGGAKAVEIRELGGQLAQNWTSFFKPDDFNLIFVVDCRDDSSLPEVAVHFTNCVKAIASRPGANSDRANVLVLYSKTDLIENEALLRSRLDKIRQLLRLSDLCEWHKDSVDFEEVECSSWSEKGFPLIKDWIRRKTATQGIE